MSQSGVKAKLQAVAEHAHKMLGGGITADMFVAPEEEAVRHNVFAPASDAKPGQRAARAPGVEAPAEFGPEKVLTQADFEREMHLDDQFDPIDRYPSLVVQVDLFKGHGGGLGLQFKEPNTTIVNGFVDPMAVRWGSGGGGMD